MKSVSIKLCKAIEVKAANMVPIFTHTASIGKSQIINNTIIVAAIFTVTIRGIVILSSSMEDFLIQVVIILINIGQ